MSRGYFAVGVDHPKHEVNIGGLWRTAAAYGAAFVFTVGRRYASQSADTPNTPVHVPLFHFDTVDDLHAHLPWSCPLVGVELHPEAKPLPDFWHPPRACYLLGAEDHGLTREALDRCHHLVEIPGAAWCLNVATAGSIVIYDRAVRS